MDVGGMPQADVPSSIELFGTRVLTEIISALVGMGAGSDGFFPPARQV